MVNVNAPLLNLAEYKKIFENSTREETRAIRTVRNTDIDELKKIAALDANEVTIDTPLELALFHYYVNFSGSRNIVNGGELLQKINHEVENSYIGKTGDDTQKTDGLMIGAAVYGELLFMRWDNWSVDPVSIRKHREMLSDICTRYNISETEIADYYTENLSAKIDAEIDTYFNNITVYFRDGNGTATLRFDEQTEKVTLTYGNKTVTSNANSADFGRALDAWLSDSFSDSRMNGDAMRFAHMLPSFIYAHENKFYLIDELKTRLFYFLTAPSEDSFRQLVQVRRAANQVFRNARVPMTDKRSFEQVLRSINNRVAENYDTYLGYYQTTVADQDAIARLVRGDR